MNNRLTKKVASSVVFPAELVGLLPPDNKVMYELLHKLAAYEDTGLAPEEIVNKPGYRYRLINTDVDGGGMNVETWVSFDRPLNTDELNVLLGILRDAKRPIPKGHMDCEDIVETALKRFKSKHGIPGAICPSPCCYTINF